MHGARPSTTCRLTRSTFFRTVFVHPACDSGPRDPRRTTVRLSADTAKRFGTGLPCRNRMKQLVRPRARSSRRTQGSGTPRPCLRPSPANRDGVTQRGTRVSRDVPRTHARDLRKTASALRRERLSFLPQVRCLRAWICAMPLRVRRPQHARRVSVQAARNLPELLRIGSANGRGGSREKT